MNCRILAHGQNAIEEVASALAGTAGDYRRSLVLFPGKRPAHVLRKLLAERSGRAFIPPRINSFDEFVAYVLDEHVHERPTKLSDLDAVALLYHVHRSLKNRIGEKHFTDLQSFLPLGFSLFAELEELRMAEVSVQQIRQHLGAAPYGRYQLLPVYYEKFYAAVRASSKCSRSMQYERAANAFNALELTEFDTCVIAGFYALTPLERRIFRGVAERLNATVFFQEGPGLDKQLDLLGVVAAQPNEERSSAPQFHFYKAADTHGQVFVLNDKIRALKESGAQPDPGTVVVLPAAEALFPVVREPLALLNPEEYNISLGYPLSRTPLYGFFLNLLNLHLSATGEYFSVSSYVAFILHPYVKNIRWQGRSDVTRTLLHAIESRLQKQRSKGRIALAEIESAADLFTAVADSASDGAAQVQAEEIRAHLHRIHEETIRKLTDVRRVGEFGERCADILEFLRRESGAGDYPFFGQTAEKFLESFSSMSASLLGQEKLSDVEGLVSFFRSAVSQLEIHFPGTPLRGLQVLGLLETRNLPFERVFILDANDDVLPGHHGSHVLLPDQLRTKLQLETSHDRDVLAEYYWNLLIRGSKEVHIFFCEDERRERSRFVQKLQWELEQQAGALIDEESRIQTIQYRVNLSNLPPKPVPKTEETIDRLRSMKFSSSKLDEYLRCQIRFYYTYVLGLREAADVDDEFNAMDVGNLVHRILGEFFRGKIGKVMKESDVEAKEIERIADRQFRETLGVRPAGELQLLMHQVKKQLRNFLEYYQVPAVAKNAITIEDVEREISVEKEGFIFEGRLDRIERRDDAIRILDYKTGKRPSGPAVDFEKLKALPEGSWKDAVKSFQLPMYQFLYVEHNHVSPASVIPAYLYLGQNRINDSIEVGMDAKGLSVDEMYQSSERALLSVAREITDETKQFVPPERLQDECPRCPFNAICGTQWVRTWKFSE